MPRPEAGVEHAPGSEMPAHHQTAVWIDHHEARVFHVEAGGFDEAKVDSPHHHIHRHPSSTAEHDHPDDIHRLFHEVATALGDSEQVLVVGPGTAKLQLVRYLHEHASAVEQRIVGIETVDHPTDRQLAAYAAQYFDLEAPRGRRPGRQPPRIHERPPVSRRRDEPAPEASPAKDGERSR